MPIARIAREHQVSRKFVYEQEVITAQALEDSLFSSKRDDEVLSYLLISKTWLFQPILALVLICHSSYRSVELLRDLFDWSISMGTVAILSELPLFYAQRVS